MKNVYLTFLTLLLAFGAFGQDEEYVLPNLLEGSCTNPDSNQVIVYIDYNKNCPDSDPTGILAGQEQLVVHSGVNDWATIVQFDSENPLIAENIGNNIFRIVINTVETYGMELADIVNISLIPNNGLANPSDAWEASIREDKESEGGFGASPCTDMQILLSAIPSCAELAKESSVSLFGATTAASSCVDTVNGNITLEFDNSLNCPEADTAGVLAGAEALGFHSGANSWSVQVDWDEEGAMQAVNNGSDIFTVTINTMAYYGLPLDSLENILFVLNNGIADPEAPWDASGRDERDGGFGGAEPCSDLMFIISEAPVCEVEPEVISSAALLSTSGDEASCVDPNTGRARISFDLSLNCPEADSMNVLPGAAALGFHSGANMWASTVSWDDSTAMQATNNGSDIFSVTLDIAQYYGVEFDSLENIIMVMNNGPAAPDAAWDATGRDDRDVESFGALNPCSDLVFQVSEMSTCDLADAPEVLTSPALLSEAAGSCMDRNLGLLRIGFDQSMNCLEADTAGVLAGIDAIGFHSGANDWSSIVAWDDEGSKQAQNEGNNVFALVIDPAAYYGLPLDSIQSISFLYNNGVANPDDPWGVTGKDVGAGGFGGEDPCKNLLIELSELPGCDLSETVTSHALFNGAANSCIDTSTGMITLQFDYNFNCPEADSAGFTFGSGYDRISFRNQWMEYSSGMG